MRFGEYLLLKKVIDGDTLNDAVATQRYKQRKLGRVLRDLGVVSQSQLNKLLSDFLKPPVLESAMRTSEEIVNLDFPIAILKWSENRKIVPYFYSADSVIFITTIFDDEIIESAERDLKLRCELILTDLDSFNYLRKSKAGVAAHTENNISEIAINAVTTPYTALFRDTVSSAKALNSSDIHIQPTRTGVEIRLRINGDMMAWKTLSLEHRQSFINEAKRLSNLSIAVSGKAQDSRVSFPEWNLDLRVSLLPSQFGEKIVLRLLDMGRDFKIDALGFDHVTYSDIKAALKEKSGVIIISGPTGSGKTTSLYTLLCELDRNAKNIITLEDPIEYSIKGLTQVQVNAKLSFSDALRSVLRQDPDVILVGEIRDHETADLCFKAASTGHLVLSTLHANGAKEVVGRLLNLGVDRYMIESCLRFSAAQRLIKKICLSCSQPANEQLRASILEKAVEYRVNISSDLDLKIRNPIGCQQCQLGSTGRQPILEYLRNNEIKSFLTDEMSLPIFTNLQTSALRMLEKGGVDANDVLEIG